jgi:hypothetical protein
MGDEIRFYHDVLEDEFEDEEVIEDSTDEFHTPENSDNRTSGNLEISVEDMSAK